MRNRILAVLVAATMTVGLLTGCGGKEETAKGTAGKDGDTSEHVVLTMYCIGDEGGIYAQDHLDAVNEVLTEKINAEIDPVMVSWGDYKTKLPMVWASGEAYDLTYTSNWTGYFHEAGKGAFMDITELFPKYAPKTYAEFEENGRLETTKLDGKLYMVPNNKEEFTGYIYNYREDLRKKYDCPEIVDQNTFNEYLQAIADNETGMTAYANNGIEAQRFENFLNEHDWSRPVEGTDGVLVYDLNDPSKVFDVTQTDEYKTFLEETRNFYENGYWSQSIMAETTPSKDNFTSGLIATYLGNVYNSNEVYANIKTAHPDWEIGVYSSDMELSDKAELVTPSNNGMAVGAYSKNPDRALMFVELMYQDQEVYDLVMNGLEGITYEKDEETMTKWIPEGVKAEDIVLKNLGMGFDTDKFRLGSKNDSELVKSINDEMVANAIEPGLGGFSVNQDSISAEIAALQSVYAEYKVPAEKGVIDPKDGIPQLHQALKQAGIEKVMEEINNQIKEYTKATK